MQIGTMVIVKQNQVGWIVEVNKRSCRVRLKNGTEIKVHETHLSRASKGFKSPNGRDSDRFEPGSAEFLAAEGHLSDIIQGAILCARTYKNLKNAGALLNSIINNTWSNWSWEVEAMIGQEACNRIGESVANVMGFNEQEAKELSQEWENLNNMNKTVQEQYDQARHI